MTSTLERQPDAYRVHKKLAKVGKDAQIFKRPLQRPAIVSSYASKEHSKIVYLSSKTHFMSAVKRIEKLLRQSEKRSVQSATTQARSSSLGKQKGRGDDEIVRIASVLNGNQTREAVIAKGTGKAIMKAMQVGLWFQERSQYAVTLRTATVSAIDDVHVKQNATNGAESTSADLAAQSTTTESEVQPSNTNRSTGLLDLDLLGDDQEESQDYTRIRQLSVLEVHVSIR